ncbi:MAG: hypothetical protein J5758_04295 [Abditibacteriota bacterium]|nr:hypothetical protein [Abditibacteriota bacterium]
MKKTAIVVFLCLCSMLALAAEAPESLSVEQAKKEAASLIKASREIVNIFYFGLECEDGENYAAASPFPFLPVKSDKYKSVADIRKAAEKIMTKRAAYSVFADYALNVYPRYKDYEGRLYSCINCYENQDLKFLSWDVDTLQIAEQSKGKAVLKMRTFNPNVNADNEDVEIDPYCDSFMDIEWEDGVWKLASSPTVGSMDPARRPKDLQKFLEGVIPEENRAFDKPSKDVKVVWDIKNARINFLGEDWMTVECPFKETGLNKNTYNGMMDFYIEADSKDGKLLLLGEPGAVPERYRNTCPDYMNVSGYIDYDPDTVAVLTDYGAVDEYYWPDKDKLPSYFEQIAREEFTGPFETLLKGDWAFTLIPREKDTKVEIYTVNDKGQTGALIKSFSAKPLILFAGKGETRADMEIRLITADKKTFRFRPVFNGKDGTIDLPKVIKYRRFEAAG